MHEEHPRQILAEGKFMRLVKRGRWEWVERTNCSSAVVIMPVTREKQVVFIEQYRHPLSAKVIELPAGLVGDDAGAEDEHGLAAAKRELLEETGYASENWEFLFEGPSSPGLTSEAYAMYLATDAYRIADGGGDETEQIAVRLVPLDEAEAWLKKQHTAGLLVDPKVYSGLYFAMRS
jgi:ADP-ribose pyrophosphatase